MASVHRAPRSDIPTPKALELLRPVTKAYAQNEPSLRNVVQRGHLLGHIYRVQQGQKDDRCRQLHIAGFRRQPTKHRPRLEMLEGVDQVVMPPAEYIEPGVPGGPELFQVVLPLLLMVYGITVDYMAHLVAYAHCMLPA